MMKKYLLSIAVVTALISCDIDKKGQVELPEVDVDVDAEAGDLPSFDVDWADVNVGTRTKMVEVPKVVVVMEEEEIEVPYVDVDMPEDYEDKEKMERTLRVEAEVDDVEHNLDIKEIRAYNNKLYVIAELEKMTQSIAGKTMRVQDQIELNAPNMNVEYIIVGEKPNRLFNNQYRYLSSMNDLDDEIANAKVIYNR
ncbi:hypothetical protein [Dokdonia sp. Hel_I_53]|uniref:hypothetical protein n=1 Tax=Dokdonia sp. Hel_I_53 TaxID=1566287 RepID=UPI00119AF5EA|nr:hypothetical protein [Dokdonia sp. Hel_I_53]TVZ53071.1 hypothetical protein OD90_2263 [Dokdonia sp. Hel_I_53]